MDFFDQLQDLNRPTVTKKPWMEAVTLTLAVTADLDRIADECIASKIFALDIETTGLDARVFTQADGSKVTNDKIVGLCIAPNEKQSYYLPIRHKDDGAAANIPPRMVRDMLLKIQASGAVTIFHNGKFDQEFLEHDPAGAMGNWDEPSKWEDTILLAYLRDAREKRRGLKHLAKTMLDREMIELEDLFPKGIKRLDFSTLDPTWEPTVWYAASDALNTLALYHKLNPEVTQKDPFGKGQATVYKIEKICITATRWMERCRVPMDRGTIIKLIKLGQHEWFESLAELYSGVETILGRDVRPGWFKSMQGQHHRINNPFDADCMEPSYMGHREQAIKDLGPDPDVKVPKSVPSLTDPKVRETVQFPNTYDVTIPTELGLLLRELGVEGLAVTEKSGQVKTSKDELDRIFEDMGDDLPFAPKIKRFREVAKGLSSNLFPVYHDLAPENSPDGRLWVGFNGTRTDTGRFATKASESKDFTGQSRWNLHSIPATYDKSKPECVRKMRTSIKAGPGKILFAIDYSGVELRIVTNLSGEPKWVDEFFRCSGCDHRFEKGSCPPHFCPSCWSDKIGDLHTLTALAIYGEDAATKSDFKLKRQNSKCVHPDTLIRMDSGYTRIGDLTFGGVDSFKPHSGKVLTPKGAFAPILETYNGGVKPLYHVISRRGVLTCSEEHKFLLADGTQKSLSSGLKAGDTLHTPVSFAAEDQEPKALSHKAFVGVPEMAYTPTMAAAYFSGLHAGDGASSTACATITHGSVEKTDALGVRYSEWQEIIMAACRDVGLEPIARKKNVYLGSRHMLRWMQTLGLVDGDPPTKRTLRVPRWILQSGKSAMAHYLGGLIDTDGTVTRGGDISICTKDFVFAGQIAEIIRAIGGEATITTSWNKKYSRWYVKVGFKRRDGALIAPYMRHPGKLARISGTSKSYDRVGNDVLLVIPAGESLCLDLHIDSEDHLYAANGLAVHNSLNFAMCYGGGGSAAQRSVGVDKEEGWRIKRQFDKSYRGLAKWWEEQHKTARKQKYVTTAYGRKYPLPDIDHTDGGFRSKAERNSVNGPVQGCLHPDTKITTSTGLIPVRDLYHNGASFKVWTGQSWADARPLYSGHKIVCMTGFTSGTVIKTSPEHLFLTWRDQTHSPKIMGDVVEWVRQQELGVGDWVATSTEAVDWDAPHYKWSSVNNAQDGHLFSKGMTPHNYKGFKIDGNSEALWEFLGLVYGDGSINEDRFDIHVGESKIRGCGSAKSVAESYAAKINDALNVGAHIYEKERPDADDIRHSMWQVKVCNKAFRDFCREVLGVEDQNTYTKRFPAALWRESLKHRAAFLRGYFSADGHASASGDAVSVRSVNVGLLRDTHDLLRSIGIRSSCREKSLRTSVLDRSEYERLIGFNLPQKTSRLAGRKNNPWEHKSDIAPPNLVKWVGETVYASSIYGGLSRGQKSAVLRLKLGSGTRFQCVEYLNKVPDAEVSNDLSKLLRYTWEKVTSSQKTEDEVEMFDVEVFDDFHAFVADGCVVHNTSADIMKFAMGLIYRECKDRGWLDRAKMCVTIHDELVFEIDEDLAEEAVIVINELMTVRTVKNLGWIIPLKNDIEFGEDWTVPFNLVAMTNPRETKPEVWSERWQRVFPKFYADYLANGGTGEIKAVVEAAPVAEPIKNVPEFTVPLSSQSRHVYTIPAHRLTPELAEVLARVVSKCMGRGKEEIVIETDRGLDLLGFPFKASFAEFKIIAGYEGL